MHYQLVRIGEIDVTRHFGVNVVQQNWSIIWAITGKEVELYGVGVTRLVVLKLTRTYAKFPSIHTDEYQ